MSSTSHGGRDQDWKASPTRDAYKAPAIVPLGSVGELTGSLTVGTASDHAMPGQHLNSGPGQSPGA
jgi:hypothetical protein